MYGFYVRNRTGTFTGEREIRHRGLKKPFKVLGTFVGIGGNAFKVGGRLPAMNNNNQE
jgi:hypothetical protein